MYVCKHIWQIHTFLYVYVYMYMYMMYMYMYVYVYVMYMYYYIWGHVIRWLICVCTDDEYYSLKHVEHALYSDGQLALKNV